MKKYLWAFKMSFAHMTTYRLNFFIGRLRNVIIFLLFYFVWLTLTRDNGRFAGFTTEELTTYVVLVTLMRPLIFGDQSRRIAMDINDGSFSQYLIKPVNHFVFFYFRELAERSLLFISALVEIVLLSILFKIHYIFPQNIEAFSLFLAGLFFAHILYFVISYAVSLLAFWSHQAMGPRFLFEWFLEFASGAFFPIRILSAGWQSVLALLPFMYLIYAPVGLYLGWFSASEIQGIFTAQIFFIFLAAIIARVVFRRGLLRYSGEGI